MLATPGKSSERATTDHASAGSRGLRLRMLQRPQNLYWVRPNRLGDRQEFDDIDAALAALVLGDEGLRPFQPFGQVMLGETRLFARLYHQLAKGGLLGGVDGFTYAARARSHRPGRLIPSSDYPK